MCTTEMVQLAKEFVTKLDDKLDLKDPYGERLITLFPQAVLWHECVVACPNRKGKRKKKREEGKSRESRESKCKRKKADNLKTDITKVRMNRICWWSITPSKIVMSIHKRVKIQISYYYILLFFINFIKEFSIYILSTPSYFSLQLLFLLILKFMTFVLNYYCYTHLYSYGGIYVYTHIQSFELI